MARLQHIPLVALPLIVAGCAGDLGKNDRPATSLVYSPTAGMTTRGEEQSTASRPDDPQPPTGRACRLHFRRDVMGIPATLTGNNVGADRVAISGVVDFVSREWIVFRVDSTVYWVPRDTVLAVEYTSG
jgi:hypothetical protein